MKKKTIRKIKAWAVINTELNEPCVFINDGEARGSAIFVSDWKGVAKKEAKEFVQDIKGFKQVKVVEVELTYKI